MPTLVARSARTVQSRIGPGSADAGREPNARAAARLPPAVAAMAALRVTRTAVALRVTRSAALHPRRTIIICKTPDLAGATAAPGMTALELRPIIGVEARSPYPRLPVPWLPVPRLPLRTRLDAGASGPARRRVATLRRPVVVVEAKARLADARLPIALHIVAAARSRP